MKKNKIISLKSLNIKLNELSKSNVIIHCHGVFDLLHIGHIQYFDEAKSMGDLLVVTLTPDKFVNKGPGRPAFSEKYRSEAISALEIVDFVAISKWPTAIEIIQLLKPNIYVKGPDYKNYNNDISGNIKLEEDAIKSVGGKIAFTTGDIFSSSTIINQRISKFTNKQRKYLDNLKSKYTIKKINQYINNLSKLRVMLIGEVIIDEYVFCNTVGKSGKEPVLVNQIIDSEKYAGGILAVANQVSPLCNKGAIISYLGDRNSQIRFIEKNAMENIDIDFIIKKDSPTILKTRFIDNYTKTKTLGVYDINDTLIDNEEEIKLLSKVDNTISKYDITLVVDYGHGLITQKVVDMLENRSNYLAVNTQLNSFNIGYHSISKYKNVDYVCVHEGELRHDYRNRSDSLEELIKTHSDRIKSKVIVITQGTKGSIAYSNGEFINCPAFSNNVIDRIGAGDTLLAITTLCFSVGMPTDLSLFIGNLAAANTVASMGTGMKLDKTNLLKSIESLLK